MCFLDVDSKLKGQAEIAEQKITMNYKVSGITAPFVTNNFTHIVINIKTRGR